MKKIFIVEDDDGIRELLEYLFISQEFAVKAFPTAESFKKTIATQHPDLILMDVMLPDGNGMEMCRGLHGSRETNDIPVVLMSAHADKNLTKNSCAKDFIAKPFDVDDLLSRVNKYIG